MEWLPAIGTAEQSDDTAAKKNTVALSLIWDVHLIVSILNTRQRSHYIKIPEELNVDN